MQSEFLSRRHFALVAGAAAAAATEAQTEPLTAESAILRMNVALGGVIPVGAPDGFKAGDLATRITGIATTAMATVDVLKRAAVSRLNLVFTYEPTFFGRADGPAPTGPPGRGPTGLSPTDPVYAAKKEFIDKNGLVVFRLRDQWQNNMADSMVSGLAESLGWSSHIVKRGDVLFDIPAASAEEVAAHIRNKLKLRGGLRAVGDRKARVRRVLLHPGPMTPPIMWARYSEADLIVAGEVREWENTFFAADLLTAGQKCGLMTIGRVVSEDPGMRVCANWLKTVVKGVPVEWIGAGDPYWRAS
jgi:hypothetical protein